MTEYLIGVVAAALVNDIALQRASGAESPDTLARLKRASCMGGVTILVTLAASALSYALYYGVLSPLGLQAAWIPVFTLTAALCAALCGQTARNGAGYLADLMDAQWPLLTLNAALLGVTLHGVWQGVSFAGTVLTALLASAIFAAALVALTAIESRLDTDALPESVRGFPALLLIAALVSMALTAFAGL